MNNKQYLKYTCNMHVMVKTANKRSHLFPSEPNVFQKYETRRTSPCKRNASAHEEFLEVQFYKTCNEIKDRCTLKLVVHINF